MCILYEESLSSHAKFFDLDHDLTYILVHVSENLTCHNFWTIRGRDFICAFLVVRPFRSYQNCWPCHLHRDLWPTYLKTLTFAITFEPLVIGLSYSLWRGLPVHTKSWPCKLDCDLRPTCPKTLTFAFTFEPLCDQSFYRHLFVRCVVCMLCHNSREVLAFYYPASRTL